MEKRKRVLIVDDQPFARADLLGLLESFSDLIMIVGAVATLKEAHQVFEKEEVDLVFLDIHLRGESGFELVGELPAGAALVFVTAYDQYAVRAFEVNALDYLVKPVKADRLGDTLKRLGLSRPAPPIIGLRKHDRLLVEYDNVQRFVPLSEIRAVTVLGGNYSLLDLTDGTQPTIRRSLKTWEEVLPTPFLRVHRGAIVNLSFASELVRESDGTWGLSLQGRAERVQVSRRRVSELRAKLSLAKSDDELSA